MDAIDQAIVRCVLRDARATYAQIGKAAGLSAPAAKRRLDRLVATGAIRGFTALVDPQALAWHTEAFVEVYCTDNQKGCHIDPQRPLPLAVRGITRQLADYQMLAAKAAWVLIMLHSFP